VGDLVGGFRRVGYSLSGTAPEMAAARPSSLLFALASSPPSDPVLGKLTSGEERAHRSPKENTRPSSRRLQLTSAGFNDQLI